MGYILHFESLNSRLPSAPGCISVLNYYLNFANSKGMVRDWAAIVLGFIQTKKDKKIVSARNIISKCIFPIGNHVLSYFHPIRGHKQCHVISHFVLPSHMTMRDVTISKTTDSYTTTAHGALKGSELFITIGSASQ